MRRKDLSHDQLDKVIKLRKSGNSWAKIVRETGLPRRSVVRAYENWEREQSMTELKAARTNVATEAFRQHVDDLIRFAQALTDHLVTPNAPDLTVKSQELLDRFWKSEITDKGTAIRSTEEIGERELRRRIRRNKLLFGCLKEHTRGKVNWWETLDAWGRAWDEYISGLDNLRDEANKMIRNFLDQDKGLLDGIKTDNPTLDPVVQLGNTVVRYIWNNNADDRVDTEPAVVLHGDQIKRATQITLPDILENTALQIAEEKLVKKVVSACNRTAQNLLKIKKEESVKQISSNRVRTVQSSVENLEDMLEPLQLRPLIIRTRCELCPA
jgi:hypothetical protein